MTLLSFLRSPAAKAATAIILVQGFLLYGAMRPESVPSSRPLAQLPLKLGSWSLIQEGIVDEDTQAVLRADDTLNRVYGNGTTGANLFVAAFRSQREGKAPHSPKNCLPGSGWVPMESGEMKIDAGLAEPITVNRYIVAQGDNRSLVMYWYQSRDRVVASEYRAKFWVVYDAMHLNRTDTALVRVVVPIRDKNDAEAQKTAEDFVRSFFMPLKQFLPA